MAGDTLTPFFGEFLIQPIPLELSGNWCSHSCEYCFANLNKPDRASDLPRTQRFLADYQNRKTLEATLLQQGYPVLISNRVDPFSISNYREMVPLMRQMTELGIPIALQTKGGKGIDEVLEFLPPSCWYITITTLDDNLRRKIEPGAPSIESRFELLEKLKAKGHTTYVGLNPWVEEWCPLADVEKLLQRARDCGVYGVWSEVLHFQWKQLRNMSESGKRAIAPSVFARAKKRGWTDDWLNAFLRVFNTAERMGLEVYGIGQGRKSNYFQPYHDLYRNTFPVAQGFVNHCHDTQPKLISFADFADFMEPSLPQGVLNIGHYIGATVHAACKTPGWTNWMTYRDLLKIIWQDRRIKGNLSQIECFAIAQSGGEVATDSEGLPLVAFDPKGFDGFYVEAA